MTPFQVVRSFLKTVLNSCPGQFLNSFFSFQDDYFQHLKSIFSNSKSLHFLRSRFLLWLHCWLEIKLMNWSFASIKRCLTVFLTISNLLVWGRGGEGMNGGEGAFSRPVISSNSLLFTWKTIFQWAVHFISDLLLTYKKSLGKAMLCTYQFYSM